MIAQPKIESERCLEFQDLEDLDSGNLSDDQLNLLFEHVSHCSACDERLKEWRSSPDDKLAGKLRRCFEVIPFERDPALRRLEERALDQTGSILGHHRQAANSDAQSLSKLLIGKSIGNSLIVGELGCGGMGIVFKGWQESIKRTVAVKVIRSGVFADAKVVARFRTEAGAIARLQHPNVAQLYEFAEHAGLPYFVMEMVDGGSLSALLAKGQLPCRRAAELVRTVAGAVEYAHQKHVVHRDLKPSNVLMTLDGSPKIADFGLAKLLDEQDGQTQSDAILGSPSYMAPEQAAGQNSAVGPRTDVYALGAILYESITREPPFQGDDRVDTLRKVREERLVPPSRWRRDVPRDLEAICVKCLEKSPARRYPSAQALADDLGLWLDNKRPQHIPGLARRSLKRLKHNWILATAIAVCMLVAGALYLRDPDRPLREMQARIAKGEPAKLIGETGKPAWQRWLNGEDTSKIVMEQDGVFRLNAFRTASLELLPAVDCERYRFQARIRHESSNLHGGVGIFVARQSFLIDGEPVHFVVEIFFNDVRGYRDLPIVIGKKPIPPSINVPKIIPRFFSSRRTPLNIDASMVGNAGTSFEPPGAGNTNWRELALIVGPEGITAEWESQRFYLSADSIRESFAREQASWKRQSSAHALLKIENFNFNPRGGLGLLVFGGSAAFCSASVVPLADEKP
ncbi:MAG: serine/threonine protein kinase [Planctomycetes bacterium]|nr:serine/threonine protein kinase [Planctomycetota bacterium]